MLKSSRILFALVVLSLLTSGSARAASIVYGDFAATNVSFNDVEESSITDPVPLYGAPSVSGDALLMTPANFGAISTNGLVDITDGRLTTSILANTGRYIQKITAYESGDYLVFGPNATVQVGAPVFIRIDEVEGKALPVPINFATAMTFAPGSSFSTPADSSGIWIGGKTVDIDAILLSEGITGRATKVQFTMDNTLTAFAPEGSAAFIKKKAVGNVALAVQTGTIPEPSTLALAGVGLAGLAFAVRRRFLG